MDYANLTDFLLLKSIFTFIIEAQKKYFQLTSLDCLSGVTEIDIKTARSKENQIVHYRKMISMHFQ